MAELQRVSLHQVHVLVNSPAFAVEAPFFDMAEENFRAVLDVNLVGAFLTSSQFWPLLVKPGASIVNISSIHGRRVLRNQAAYGAAKGGLENLTRAMALDAAPYGVRVNAVAPGFVQGERWSRWLDPLPPVDRVMIEQQVRATVPLGRLACESEIADVVRWLASDGASYVTGEVIAVDGGLGAMAFQRVDTAPATEKGVQ